MKLWTCATAAALALLFTASANPSSAATLTYEAILSGPAESPPNASPGTGLATALVDTVAHTLQLNVAFQDLIGTTTIAHIHAPTAAAGTGIAGVATQTPSFIGFPAGVTSGTYNTTLDLTDLASYNAAYVTANGGTAAGAETALLAALANGKAYFNIHSTVFTGGEIRGFFELVTPSVPLPTTAAACATLATLNLLRRGRRS